MAKDPRDAFENIALAVAAGNLAAWMGGSEARRIRRLVEDGLRGGGPVARAIETIEARDPTRARRIRRALATWVGQISRLPQSERLGRATTRVLDLMALPVRRMRSAAILTAAWDEVPDDVKANVLKYLETRRAPGVIGTSLRSISRNAWRRFDLPRRRGRGLLRALATVAGLIGGFAAGRALYRHRAGVDEDAADLEETTAAGAVATVAVPLGAVRRRVRRGS